MVPGLSFSRAPKIFNILLSHIFTLAVFIPFAMDKAMQTLKQAALKGKDDGLAERVGSLTKTLCLPVPSSKQNSLERAPDGL